MKTVTAARIHNYDEAKGVRAENVLLPEPLAGELLVDIHAAGVNPIDWKVRAGYLQRMMQLPLPLPFTLGGDFSGVVNAVGASVAGVKVGDEVYGQSAFWSGGSGSFAKSCIAQAGSVAAKPRSASHTEAAGLPLVGVSALQALTEHLRISAGQKVLIHGGAGGIGSIAIQLAKHLGAHVATTVSAKDIAYAKGLGADTVIDYRKQEFDEVLGDLDAVLDTVGGETYVRSFKVLRERGRLVSMLEQPRRELMDEFGVQASMLSTQVTTERLTKLADLVDQGALCVHIDRTFPLERASAALQYVEKDSPRGKVVLKIV